MTSPSTPGKADTAQLDGSAEAHPYYVRTAAPDDFLRSVTADHWGAGVVTSAVNTYAMLAWARRQLAAGPCLLHRRYPLNFFITQKEGCAAALFPRLRKSL